MVFFTLGGNDNPNAVAPTQTFLTTVPFEGFYEGYDYLLDWYLEQATAELDFDQAHKVTDFIDDNLDKPRYFTQIAQAYVAAFNDWVNTRVAYQHNFTFDIKLNFVELISPREYNFLTDVITATLTAREYNAIYDYITPERFTAFVADACANREGYVSYYSANVNEWLPFAEWTPAQRGILLDCFLQVVAEKTGVKDLSDELASHNLMADFMANGRHDNIFYDCLSESAAAELNKLIKPND
jgi:hypothetical protein